MERPKLTEPIIVDAVESFLLNKANGNWHAEKTKKSDLHMSGVDLIMIGGKRNSEYFIIECKGKSYAKSASSINREGWLNALGQLVTRMTVSRVDRSGRVNRAYRYGLGLPKQGATVAPRRIPKNIAKFLNLYVFSVDDSGFVEMYTPRDFQN